MESVVKLKYLRSSARKARLVADAIRGKMVSEALSLLELSIHKRVARDFIKIIKSALANLQSKNPEMNIEMENFYIKELRVDNGPVMKRYRPRAKGSASPILKRTCHVLMKVSN